MELGLRDTRALVTASSQGIGRACAASLIGEGARVMLCARDESRLAAACQEIGAEGYSAIDLSSPVDATRLPDEAAQRLGGLDILVVNAGPPAPGTFDQVDDDAWQRAHSGVVMSAVRLIRAAIPHLTASGRGRIVTITGYGVREPISNLVVSNAARASVAVLAKTLSRDLASSGITVNNIAPGPVFTDRLRGLQERIAGAAGITYEEQVTQLVASIPVGKVAEPGEIGALCAYLCSTTASYLTGQTIVIDGGVNRSV
jgi:3-oxoacyl-[acyl-carrier protein] reductase